MVVDFLDGINLVVKYVMIMFLGTHTFFLLYVLKLNNICLCLCLCNFHIKQKWVLMDHRQIRDKITIAFRDIMKRQQSAKARRAEREKLRTVSATNADVLVEEPPSTIAKLPLQGKKKGDSTKAISKIKQKKSITMDADQSLDMYFQQEEDDKLQHQREEDDANEDYVNFTNQSVRGVFQLSPTPAAQNTSNRVSTDLRQDSLTTYFPQIFPTISNMYNTGTSTTNSSIYHNSQAVAAAAASLSLDDVNNTLYARLPTPTSLSASIPVSDATTEAYNRFLLSNEMLQMRTTIQSMQKPLHQSSSSTTTRTTSTAATPYYPFALSMQEVQEQHQEQQHLQQQLQLQLQLQQNRNYLDPIEYSMATTKEHTNSTSSSSSDEEGSNRNKKRRAS
jgi:hypothetical protein